MNKTDFVAAYLYGAHPGEGSLTRYIANAFQDNIRK